MKKLPYINRIKCASLILFMVFFIACSVPKATQEQQLKSLPEKLDVPQLNKLSDKPVYVPVTVSSYFKDQKLEALLQKALSQNPDYLIMQERIAIANAHLKVSKMALLPSLDIVADASATRYGKYTMEGIGNYDTNLSQNITPEQRIATDATPNYFLGGRVSWEADLWGRLNNKKRAALQRYFASEKGMKLLEAKLLTDVADLYFQLVALDKKAIIYKQNLKTQKRALDIVSAQRSVGKASELAVQQFAAQNSNILAEAREIDLSINQIEKALLTLTGEYGGEINRSADFLSGDLAVLNQQISAGNIIHKRPDVEEAFFEFSATRADAKSARAAFFPKLTVGGYVGINSFSFPTLFDGGSLAWQLLGGLAAPVFNKGEIKQQFLVATKQQQIAFYHYQNTVTTAFNELSALLFRTTAFGEVLNYKSNEIDHLEIAVNVANELYVTGYANYLEIISAQKNKLQAELDFVELQLKNSGAQVQLYKALGGLIK
ncbi:efflux transporter outer membrane subunit [Flavobacterium sp. MAHUQ-51]|uniref:efflux transporter outer membrane subunit n=1 Tax=Flavobacterium sp. GCM10022190 TaxID=3252639 RepID=UPI00360AB6C0